MLLREPLDKTSHYSENRVEFTSLSVVEPIEVSAAEPA